MQCTVIHGMLIKLKLKYKCTAQFTKNLRKLIFFLKYWYPSLHNVATEPKFSGTLKETEQVLIATTKLLLNSKQLQCYVNGVRLQGPFLCNLITSTIQLRLRFMMLPLKMRISIVKRNWSHLQQEILQNHHLPQEVPSPLLVVPPYF